MEKKFYTFEEILLALRDEYIKNQLLLKKLEEYYTIVGKSVETHEIIPNFQEDVNADGILYDKHLYLYVREKVNKLWGTIVRLLNPNADVIRSIVYDINNRYSKNYSFIKKSVNSPSKQLTINITNPVEFDRLVDEILNSEFMSLTEKYYGPMIGGYTINIHASQIYLGKYWESVLYNAHGDIVQFRGIECQYDAQSFINQPIPEFYLHEDVKKMINRNMKSNQKIKIDEYNFSKVTKLDVKEYDNGLQLVKRR